MAFLATAFFYGREAVRTTGQQTAVLLAGRQGVRPAETAALNGAYASVAA